MHIPIIAGYSEHLEAENLDKKRPIHTSMCETEKFRTKPVVCLL